MKINWKRIGLALGLSLSLLVTGCQSDSASNEKKGSVELVYVEWDTEIASTHVVGEVLEDLGYDVKLTPLDNAVMWEAVSKGEADGMVAAWLPGTHAAQLEQYGEKMIDLGPNLEGAKIGLVVPEYMNVDSIEDLTNEAKMTITGIEPGAGVVQASEEAVSEYENLNGWKVQTSSSGAMATALGQAIENGEEIIVTGWSPHWKFGKYDLKYLEDPKGVFGEAESIHTFVREGLQEDLPEVYQLLDNFYWETSDMEEVMMLIQDGKSPEDAAREWVDANQEIVKKWFEG